jgi:DNA mismatch repair protein MutS
MKERLTPIRAQYLDIKNKYPQAIVFFRLGDFYETFDDDAVLTSRELNLVLTSRPMGKGLEIPMAGIPHHALDEYLARLINRGYKVAICEQMTKPGENKGLIVREVVRVVTPGTVIEPKLLQVKSNNYLVSLILDDETAGLSYVDITTSEFATTQLELSRLPAEISRLKPSEIVVPRDCQIPELGLNVTLTPVEPHWFNLDIATRRLLEHFGGSTLEGYGCAHLPLAIRTAGAILQYLETTQKSALGQLVRLSTYSTENFMAIDNTTRDNLELFQSMTKRMTEGSLLSVLDYTRTAMGGRLLRRWLGQPILDLAELLRRQDAVDWFFQHGLVRQECIVLLGQISDLERLINRVRNGVILPRELMAFKKSLESIPRLSRIIGETRFQPGAELKPHTEIIELISTAIEEQSAGSVGEGGVIKAGFSPELDNMRLASRDARQYLASLERQEREKTGIKTLKVGFNNVFGYYIEVSLASINLVPPHYIRKQTLSSGERYFTPELKEYESIILHARERIAEMEFSLFQQVCQQIALAAESVMTSAGVLAELDVFTALAEVAIRHNYIRPEMNRGSMVEIKQGRHPVVERSLPQGQFVANDVRLSSDDSQIIILTGPNMAGKSTYLKQVALIVLMAQTGSFVPAEKAVIGLVDRIFTRIGAREDLATGKSTFMVEMVETANILNNATPRSLLILDEIGRGTSTYDGMSIARAVVEYVHNYPGLGARTLFATHFHELVEMANYLPRIKNFNVAVAEDKGEVILLHRIVPGGVDKSYGIHVAKLAGLPPSVVKRANEILAQLETENREITTKPGLKRKAHATEPQISFFKQKPYALTQLEELDINQLSPIEALNTLYRLQQKAKEG